MQYNIFQNDFYNDMPGLPWAYRVTVFTGNNQTPSTILTKCVKEVSLPEMELMTYLTFYGGRAFNIPTRYRNSSSFTMKFSERNDLLAYYALRDLFSRSYDMTNTYSDFSSDMRIRVEILDPNLINLKDTNPSYSSDLNGQIEAMTTNDPYVVEIYDFTGCFVDKIDDIELDYSAEEIVEWSITVKFNDMHVKYPHQSRIGLAEDADMSERVDVPKKKRDSLGYTLESEKVAVERAAEAQEIQTEGLEKMEDSALPETSQSTDTETRQTVQTLTTTTMASAAADLRSERSSSSPIRHITPDQTASLSIQKRNRHRRYCFQETELEAEKETATEMEIRVERSTLIKSSEVHSVSSSLARHRLSTLKRTA